MANRWTLEEDAVLAKNVKDNYDNLTIAFQRTAIELDRPVNGCRQRWYTAFSNPDKDKQEQNVCFAILSSKKAMLNRKTLPSNYAEKYNKISKKKSKLQLIMDRIIRLFR